MFKLYCYFLQFNITYAQNIFVPRGVRVIVFEEMTSWTSSINIVFRDKDSILDQSRYSRTFILKI